jgi:hypothetical protein
MDGRYVWRGTAFALTAVVLVGELSGQRRGYGGGGTASPLDTRIELAAWGGWQFGGTATGYYGINYNNYAQLHLNADVNWGAALGFRVKPTALVELVWNQQTTELVLQDRQPLPDSTLFPVTVHYIQLASQVERPMGKTRLFGTGSVGVAVFDPESNRYGSETRFSFGFGGGFKSYMSRSLGVRGQWRGWITLVGSSGGGMWCGGGGCSVSYGGSAIFQSDVSGGLFLAF